MMVSLNFEIVTFPFNLLTFLLWLSFLCSIHASTVPKLLSDEHTADHVEVFSIVNSSVVCQALLIIKPINNDCSFCLLLPWLEQDPLALAEGERNHFYLLSKNRVTTARRGHLLIRNVTRDFIKHSMNSKRQKDC